MTGIAVVIGATGLVGSSLVDQLACAPHIKQVITLTRRPFSHSSDKVSNTVLDFASLPAHAALFTGDMLFMCLGTTRRQAGSIAAQRRVDLDYQLCAATLAAQQGVKHLLLVSSSGANALSKSPYLKMKGELEQKIKALNVNHISIVQPSLLIGQRAQLRIAEKLGSLMLPLICTLPGLRRYRPINGAQVAQRLVQLSQQPSVKVETLRLADIFVTSGSETIAKT